MSTCTKVSQNASRRVTVTEQTRTHNEQLKQRQCQFKQSILKMSLRSLFLFVFVSLPFCGANRPIVVVEHAPSVAAVTKPSRMEVSPTSIAISQSCLVTLILSDFPTLVPFRLAYSLRSSRSRVTAAGIAACTVPRVPSDRDKCLSVQARLQCTPFETHSPQDGRQQSVFATAARSIVSLYRDAI